MNQLEQLRAFTTVVADTGDIGSLAEFAPTDTTTNPSLLLQAAQKPAYAHLLDDALGFGARVDAGVRDDAIMDKLAVNFGREILALIPGRVSTEVDARLSFDTGATIARAERLIALYEDAGIGRERVLIKIASTWEGIRAAAELERRDIHCNLTLLFSFAQAAACAEAGVTLISPFVGRILDWYRKHEGRDAYPAAEDPGVRSVTRIYNYFKRNGYRTQIMGASFRNSDEIRALAGCDLLTIAPALMAELAAASAPLQRMLDPRTAMELGEAKAAPTEAAFRWQMNEDAMATEKLAEGIRKFAEDTQKLQAFLHRRAGE
ncbi:MAG: transaldolase [Pseudomonadales bacterium]|jgi:transaldolase|nr:transaldolase [Pseudomonadales bacterium]MBP7911184.1 transaldolase [Pseudomonadales bacterium]